MTSNAVLWNLNRKRSLLVFCLIFYFWYSFFLFFSFELDTNKKDNYNLKYHYKLFNQPNVILIQYPCFSSTARNLGTNCLIAFRNGFKSVAQSFHTAFIFVFNSSELNGSPAAPWYIFRRPFYTFSETAFHSFLPNSNDVTEHYLGQISSHQA